MGLSCRNHPKVSARRNCYFCKAPICPNCQKKSHHHIFCSDNCISGFANGKSFDQIPKELEQLDQNLSEEIQEHSEIIRDSIQDEVNRFEDNLDKALTTLATMVEGGDAALASDLQKAIATIEQILKGVDRESNRRSRETLDGQEKLAQLSLQQRESILSTKELLEDLKRSLDHDLELISGRFQSVDESTATQIKLSNDLLSKLSKEREEIAESFKKQEKQEDINNNKTNELVAKFKKELEDRMIRLEEEFTESAASHAALAQEIKGTIQKELKRIVDDIASLTVAQRGNWNDVIKSAQKGAEKVSNELRPEISQKLKLEVDALAAKTGKELTQILQKRVARPQTQGWQVATYILSGIIFGATFASLFGTLNRSKPADVDVTQIDSKIQSYDMSLKSWLKEELKGAQEKDGNAPLIPFPASSRGSLNRPEIAFTFDGDDNAAAAPAILSALKERNLHVTMFLTGNFITKHPDIVNQIVADGHEVGNHLMAHDAVVDSKTRRSIFSKSDFIVRLTGPEEKFFEVTGKRMAKLWRAPYGELNDEVISWAASLGYRHVGWTRSGKKSLDTLDWVETPKSKLYRSANQIVAHILDFEKTDRYHLNGGIILMHLGTLRTSDYPYAKLPALFDELKAKGYRVTRVSDLLRSDVALKP